MMSTQNVGMGMTQHFLLSSAARTLSLAKVARMSDEEAFDCFKQIRWAATDGEPVCPHCGEAKCYFLKTRKIYKCKACRKQFSITSGTIFSSRKLPLRDYLFAIAIFTNGAKGHPALQLSRELGVHYMTAFVMAHKLREAMTAEQLTDELLKGEVEVDGGHFGGHIRPANYSENRVDRRLAKHQTGKRRVVMVMRERGGRTHTHVVKKEADGVEHVLKKVEIGSIVHADEAPHWSDLHALFFTKRINHQFAYSHDDACTNMAESFFSRLRRSEFGIHHHIAGKYLSFYAGEMAWREDRRRISNGEQFLLATRAALTHPVSRKWKGYWQR